MTDGCNTMQGGKTGVKKQLTEKIPQFVDFGACNDHHICTEIWRHCIRSGYGASTSEYLH